MNFYDEDDDSTVLGSVVDGGRGALPYALIHGEALVACAAWALGQAGVHAVDLNGSFEEVRESELPLVLHDSLTPMTPPEFITECITLALADDVVTVGVLPVTDTVKRIDAGLVGETLDRDELQQMVGPIVLPASVVSGLEQAPGDDLVAFVLELGARGVPVVTVPAPPQARRVASADDITVLQALTRPGDVSPD